MVIAAVCASLLSYGCDAQPAEGHDIIDLVRQSQSLETRGDFAHAADRLDAAIGLLDGLPAVNATDVAVLEWRRALLRFRASQASEHSCQWPVTRVLPLARRAANLAAGTGDPALHARSTHLHAAVALAAGDYTTAEKQASVAAAQLRAGDPCAAAESERLRVKAALISRRLSAADDALRAAETLTSDGQCAAVRTMENEMLRARLAVASADYETASDILGRIETNPVVATTPALLASALYNRSEIAVMRGQYAAAEILNERARAAYRETPSTGAVFAQIDQRAAIIRQELGDFPSAEKHYGDALEAFDCRLGAEHPSTLAVRRERARLLVRRGETDTAVAEARAVVALGETADIDPHAKGLNAALLGLVLHESGSAPPDAEAALLHALDMLDDNAHSELDRTPSLTALAEIALADGRLRDATRHATAAMDILKANASDTVQRLGRATRILAATRAARGDHADALGMAITNRDRILAQLRATAQLATYTSSFAPREIRAQTAQLLEYTWQDIERGGSMADVDDVFRTMQIVHLASGARGATGLADAFLAQHPDLADTVAEERTLLGRIDGYERLLRSASDRSETVGLRNAVQAARKRLDVLRAAHVDAPTMAEYRRLTSPRTLGMAEARRSLGPGQALWLQASFADTTYTFLVTRRGYRAVRIEIPVERLEAKVRALRTAVDLAPGVPPDAAAFPAEAAHDLYCVLFGPHDPASDCVVSAAHMGTATLKSGDELFLLPDRAMQQMAMGVLLVRPLDGPPDLAALRDAEWLARRHPHQVAPTVTAFAERHRAPAPDANAAREFVAFAPFGPLRAPLCDPDRQVIPAAFDDLATDRTGFARLIDPERAFRQSRLPMTVELVRAAAHEFGAVRNRDWFECEDATEASVKGADLSAVEILLFATHAEVGDLPADLPEPGLFFSAPATASDVDDGYLKASEIAQMDIGAELVVLSACSTGSDSGLPGASGLSGLARAFFEAGAQQLIVSHWDVAAVSSSALFQSLLVNRQRGGGGSLAVQLQRAMLDVMDGGRAPIYAHPFVWAPFTVVVGR